MIKIHLSDNVYLISDERNFTIVEECTRNEEKYFLYIAYFATLSSCINFYIDRYKVKKSDCKNFDEIIHLLKSLHKHKTDCFNEIEKYILKAKDGDDECMDISE